MKIEICHFKNNYRYIKFSYSAEKDESVIENIRKKAQELTGKVNIHSSGGSKRDANERYQMNLGGLIAEYSTKAYFNKIIDEKGLNATINSSEYYGADDHVDVSLMVDNIKKRIEVRSSFGYKTVFERYFVGAFSTIGWYVSEHKQTENKKDYYFFGIHYYDPKIIEEKLKSCFDFFLVGAASKDELEKFGFDDDLKQYSAKFRVMKPIINAPRDPIAIFEECLNIPLKIGGNQNKI